MNLLNDPLIKELFCCPLPPNTVEFPIRPCMCLGSHVIEAMMQPIEAGDRVVYISSTGHAEAKLAKAYGGDEQFHPYALKVPDQFQNKKCCDYKKLEEPGQPGKVVSLCDAHAKIYFNRKNKCLHLENVCCCPNCRGECKEKKDEKDAVEEKIQEIKVINQAPWISPESPSLEQLVRELVDLVRKEK